MPYTVVVTATRVIAARELAEPLRAGAALLKSAAPTMSAGDAARAGVLAYQLAVTLAGATLIAFYVACALYLRRPAVRLLYPLPAQSKPDPS